MCKRCAKPLNLKTRRSFCFDKYMAVNTIKYKEVNVLTLQNIMNSVLSHDWNHMNQRKTQKSCRDSPGSLETPRDGLHKKTIWREQTMKNHGKPLDLRALYFETKPNSHFQILQLCFFKFCRWIHSTWFCSQFPSHWTTFFRRFIIKISFECLGKHTSTMHDICSPKTGAWSVWYQMMSIPLSIPFNSCFFTDSSTYIYIFRL